MSAEIIHRIVEQSVTAMRSGVSDDEVVCRCIIAMAKDVASTLYLGACDRVARTAREDLLELGEDLAAQAAIVGCDLALKVRRSLHPNGLSDAAMTDAEQLVIQAFWAELHRLDDTFSETRGSA